MTTPRDWIPPCPPTAIEYNAAHRKAYDEFEAAFPSSTWAQRQDYATTECRRRGVRPPASDATRQGLERKHGEGSDTLTFDGEVLTFNGLSITRELLESFRDPTPECIWFRVSKREDGAATVHRLMMHTAVDGMTVAMAHHELGQLIEAGHGQHKLITPSPDEPGEPRGHHPISFIGQHNDHDGDVIIVF